MPLRLPDDSEALPDTFFYVSLEALHGPPRFEALSIGSKALSAASDGPFVAFPPYLVTGIVPYAFATVSFAFPTFHFAC